MTDATIGAIGERALIARIRETTHLPAYVFLGIGDDAAAIQPERGALDVLTTDSLIEGVHFRRDWTPAGAVGRKALAVNLSDLAAMGAVPRAALLSLALPPTLPLAWFDEMIDGLTSLARETRVPLVGGNIARSPGPVMIDVTLVGAARPRKMLTRGGGRPGDELYVTGALGAAAAGLSMLTAGIARAVIDADSGARDCIAAYEQPTARLRCGLIVARTRTANACMDVSDGLADAARQLAEASGTGVTLVAASVPIHPGAAAWCASRAVDCDPLELALSGGEDYELLFAVAPRRRRAFLGAVKRCSGLAVTLVGRLTKEKGERLEFANRTDPLPQGFGHF